MANDPSVSRQSTQRTPNRRRLIIVCSVIVTAAVAVGALFYQDKGSDPAVLQPTKTSTDTVKEADGYVANNNPLSPFDTESPALAKLNPALLEAIQKAARDAEADNIKIHITAGWRSASYQQKLLDEAVATYGSLKEARRFVSTPEDSHHVSGEAIDVGPTDATSWLSQHGSNYGLCQRYANEMWHYELMVRPGETCPEQEIDASGTQ